MSEILIPKRNLIWDATMMSSLQACPRRHDFQHNHNFVSVNGKSRSLAKGAVVHEFLKVYYKHIIEGATKSAAELNAHGAAELYSFTDECRNLTEDDRALALDACHQYLERWRNDSWVPLEVEVVKSKILYEDEEIRIMWKAKLDLVSDTGQGIFPIDHKSMSQRRDHITLNNQFIGQCIIMDTRVMFINTVGFQKGLKPEEKFTRPTINYSLDRILEWQTVTLPYTAKTYLMYLDSEYWPPNYGGCDSKYGSCPFIPICEADRNMREETLGQLFVVGEPWNPESE